MALFAKSKRGVDPVGQAERAFAEARDAQAKLAARLSVAQATVAEKRAAAEQAAVAGAADQVLDRAEAEMRAVMDREQTLRSALEKLDQQVVHAEQALADAVDRRDRDLVADHLENLIEGIAAAQIKFDEGTAALSSAIAEPQPQVPEAEGLAIFLSKTRREMAVACNLLNSELQSRAVRIRNGAGTFRIGSTVEVRRTGPDGSAIDVEVSPALEADPVGSPR